MEMKTFNLPDLGEGLAESEIVKWHVNVGDMVKLDQVILTVETAKATVDVPAPYAGRIVSRHGEEGDVINIGALLLEIDESGAENTVSAEKRQTADAATVVGTVSHQSHNVNVDDFWVGGSHNKSADKLITALPSARLLAKKLGVDLKTMVGSGPSGLIVDADVYEEAGKQVPGTEVLKGARRTMVSTMAESHQNVAAVTITEEALLEDWLPNEDISIRLVQAIVYACQQEPALNAWFDAETMTRCVHPTVNLGVAVDSRRGLYVPVLRHADEYEPQDVRR
ncbi:branched-chain alpha-keto acid dehydrogenase subunit E2, partial [Vibrio parahaemolyticus]